MDSNLNKPLQFLRLHIISSSIIAVVFFLIPFELYYPQRILWDEAKTLPLFFAAVGSSLFLLFMPFFFLILRYFKTISSYLSLCLFGLAIFILLADILAPLQSSPLDGFELKSKEPSSVTFIEAGLFIALGILALWKGKVKSLSFAYTASILLWVVSIGYSVVILCSSRIAPLKNLNLTYRSDLKNIYHIVLDELQTDVALSVIKDLKLKKKFEGFTFFPFNSSNYLFTKSSFPSYMTGTTYQGKEEFQEWLQIFKRQGILKSLKDHGYQITMNAPWTIWNNEFTSEYNTLSQAMQRHLQMNYPGMGDFFPIWLARLTPNFLTNETLKLGTGLEKKLSRILENVGRYPRTIGEGKEPFSSVLMLKSAIANEHKLSPYGRYTYYHAVLPHGPYVTDGKCKYTKRYSQGDVKSYYQQSVCGIKLVTRFIRELKRLKRFNNSIIILHADTGHGLRGLIHVDDKKIISTERAQNKLKDKIQRYPDWNERQLLARTLSFLAIKLPNASGPISFSTKHSKLKDLYPTLMDIVGIETAKESHEGGSLLNAISDLKDRENNFYLYDPRDKDPKITRYSWDREAALTHLHKVMNSLTR